MNNLFKGVFLSLVLASISSLVASFYLFFFRDLHILSAIFLVFVPITLYMSLNLIQNNKAIFSIDEKRVIKNIFPPFLSLFLSKITNEKSQRTDMLFGGSENLFIEYIENSEIYGEYGMGNSTLFAMSIKRLKIFSVDTDKEWFEKILSKSSGKNHFLKYVNLGVVGDWGMPIDYSKRENIKIYLNYIWSMEKKPDLVLIDGRFRVASFLTSLKECSIGTKIIFDDYKSRPHYHIVEEFIKPIRFFGNQAVFLVDTKENLDLKKLEVLINKFEYVME